GLDDFGKPAGYVKRQVEGWTRRYGKAKTDELEAVEQIAVWLADHMPPDHPERAALIHNDYKYDNLVFAPEALDQGKLLAVLDWEMATIGDPLMDLGTTLGYWVDPDDPPELRLLPFGPTSLEGNLRRLEVAERYAEQSGRDLKHILFYYVYALFKVAVILQQIYARYKRGLTQDARFAIMIEGVKLLALQATRALDNDRIDRLGR
ncbi:MAG: phosphotransferase family protein, partial [Myxococcota bacterium]